MSTVLLNPCVPFELRAFPEYELWGADGRLYFANKNVRVKVPVTKSPINAMATLAILFRDQVRGCT